MFLFFKNVNIYGIIYKTIPIKNNKISIRPSPKPDALDKWAIGFKIINKNGGLSLNCLAPIIIMYKIETIGPKK